MINKKTNPISPSGIKEEANCFRGIALKIQLENQSFFKKTRNISNNRKPPQTTLKQFNLFFKIAPKKEKKKKGIRNKIA